MKRLITAVAAALLLAGCQTDPMGMSTSVDGQWVRSAGALNNQTMFLLQTSGGSATGSGYYMTTAGKPGTLRVTGTVDGSRVALDLVFDDGALGHFSGTRTGADVLSGSIKFGAIAGDQPEQSVSFQKSTNMMMDDPMGMMMDMMRTARH